MLYLIKNAESIVNKCILNILQPIEQIYSLQINFLYNIFCPRNVQGILLNVIFSNQKTTIKISVCLTF